jgi:glycosyltransferase involved in cell wall biosynthesis
VLDLDDLEQALAPRSKWQAHPSMADLRRPGSAVYTSLLLRASGAAAGVTVASSALQNRFGGVLVPHGADTELFDPAHIDREAARQTFGFEGPTVVFAGTPRGHKGVRELAEAVGLVPRARLAVLARATDLAGPEWKRLDPVKLPLLPYEQLPCLLAAADVVAIPQLDTDAARHQMPMKVFDAMAMGRPIVATAVSDLPEVLDGCGTLVPPGEVEPLAQAIRELLDDPAEAAALGERARRRCIERYALPRIGDRLREAITAAAR